MKFLIIVFFQALVTCSHFGPTVILSFVFLNTLILCSFTALLCTSKFHEFKIYDLLDQTKEQVVEQVQFENSFIDVRDKIQSILKSSMQFHSGCESLKPLQYCFVWL
jgi:hypothetical protein